MRAFFGIALPQSARDLLSSACAAFREHAPAWASEKWVAPENYHLTLAFLGEIPCERANAIAGRAAEGVSARAAFTLALDRFVSAPRHRAATMLWATLAAGEHECADLALAVQEAASQFGIAPPARPFSAHITLVRARRPRQAPDDALAAASEVLASHGQDRIVSVGEVMLYSSTLTPRGPVYEAVQRIPLRGD